MGLIKRFNVWYDRIQEPWRFLFFMAIIVVPLSLIQFHVGFLFMLWLLIPLCVMRHFHLNRKKNEENQ